MKSVSKLKVLTTILAKLDTLKKGSKIYSSGGVALGGNLLAVILQSQGVDTSGYVELFNSIMASVILILRKAQDDYKKVAGSFDK